MTLITKTALALALAACVVAVPAPGVAQAASGGSKPPRPQGAPKEKESKGPKESNRSPSTVVLPTAAPKVPSGAVVAGSPLPDYLIGPDDVLSVVFWKEKDLSADVVVRPDGMISLPLLNDIAAVGLTPDQLRQRVTDAAGKYVEDPNVTVVVKAINSRKVFITGQVNKPGPYSISGATTVLQLIATAGGLQEFADGKNIMVMRTENGRPVSYKFNYKDVIKRKNLRQNIELKPGDTVLVP